MSDLSMHIATDELLKKHELPNGTIYEAKAEDVYPIIEVGSVTLVHSDGPYAMNKADWDRMKVADLAAWYRPHIEAWGRLCAPSASVYHWGTAEGWAAVHPEYLRQGWTFRALVTWYKPNGQGQQQGADCRTWPDVTEVCGFYQRQPSFGQLVREAVNACPDTRAGICRDIGIDSRLLQFWEEDERFPSWEIFRRAWEVLRGPFEVIPNVNRYYMQSLQSVRCATDKEMLELFGMLRAPFTLPIGITNVWTHDQVQGKERISGMNGMAVHPCQKPLKFADRIIRASSRPGDLILEPFGGTCRIAAACEQIARYKPDDARRYVCVEMNADGVDYIGPVIRQIQENGKQVTIFEALG